jgi:regulator of replication initiation timing
VDEEVVLLEEQLASAHTDVERLQSQVAEMQARASQGQVELSELKGQLDAARSQQAALEAERGARDEELARLRESVEAAEAQGREALTRFREAALAREPELPSDLVAGESVAEMEASLEKARQTVAQVRQHLYEQAQNLRVPAGAPARSEPDLSELSASEKIRLGLRRT